jgi:hypothetical protein
MPSAIFHVVGVSMARMNISRPIISLLLMIFGLVMILALLWRSELEQRAYEGLYDGVFLGFSIPLIGAFLFLFGALLASTAILKGPKSRIVLSIMSIGFIISAAGLVTLITTYYVMFEMVPFDYQFIYLVDHQDLFFNIVIIGIVIFFTGMAFILFSKGRAD